MIMGFQFPQVTDEGCVFCILTRGAELWAIQQCDFSDMLVCNTPVPDGAMDSPRVFFFISDIEIKTLKF